VKIKLFFTAETVATAHNRHWCCGCSSMEKTRETRLLNLGLLHRFVVRRDCLLLLTAETREVVHGKDKAIVHS